MGYLDLFKIIYKWHPTSEVPPTTYFKGIDLKIIPKLEFRSPSPHLRSTLPHFRSTPYHFRSTPSGYLNGSFI